MCGEKKIRVEDIVDVKQLEIITQIIQAFNECECEIKTCKIQLLKVEMAKKLKEGA